MVVFVFVVVVAVVVVVVVVGCLQIQLSPAVQSPKPPEIRIGLVDT